MSRLASVIATSAAIAAVSSMRSPVLNERKRSFYEDDAQVVPVPGTSQPATEAEAQLLGPRELVNGVTVRSAPQVESAVGSLRRSVYGIYSRCYDYLHDTKHSLYEAERQVSSTVSALHSRHEDLFPNSIYIAVAALSGNIFARTKGVVAKTVYPVALGLAAFRYFLPQTFSNTAGYLWKVEQRTVPGVAAKQVQAYEKAGGFVSRVESSASRGQQKVLEGVEQMRRSISRATGLNLDEEVSRK